MFSMITEIVKIKITSRLIDTTSAIPGVSTFTDERSEGAPLVGWGRDQRIDLETQKRRSVRELMDFENI